jgi:hypothetical protein
VTIEITSGVVYRGKLLEGTSLISSRAFERLFSIILPFRPITGIAISGNVTHLRFVEELDRDADRGGVAVDSARQMG